MKVAIDTNAITIAMQGGRERTAILVREAIVERRAVFLPVVILELLSNPYLSEAERRIILALPQQDFRQGIWERAGILRAQIRALRLKAAVPDCLIAQACLDDDIPLITYDRDFRHFERAGLQLL